MIDSQDLQNIHYGNLWRLTSEFGYAPKFDESENNSIKRMFDVFISTGHLQPVLKDKIGIEKYFQWAHAVGESIYKYQSMDKWIDPLYIQYDYVNILYQLENNSRVKRLVNKIERKMDIGQWDHIKSLCQQYGTLFEYKTSKFEILNFYDKDKELRKMLMDFEIAIKNHINVHFGIN